EGIKASISITEIFGEVRIPNAKGRLFVVPAGCLSLDYIAKVDDLHANTIIDGDQNLWSVFKCEIDEQLKPDVILIDSRTGINQWGALSLIQAADAAVIFLFPNEQNKQGIKLLLQSLQNLNKSSINFVFSPVPDVSKLDKVKEIYQSLLDEIKISTDEESEIDDNDQLEMPEPLVIPYLPHIALVDYYPVEGSEVYYNKIANLIDEETDEIERTNILTNSETETRWEIIESLEFPDVNAAEVDQKQKFELLFQRTNDFEKFLDHATCLIRGRKGTGKTALYWLFLKYTSYAQELARGRLDNTVFLSAHGRYQESRPTRGQFQFIHKNLQQNGGTWEAFWRAYLLLRCHQENLCSFPKNKKGEKFSELKNIINNLPKGKWQSEYNEALLELSTNSKLSEIVNDAINNIIHGEAKKESQKIWFLYDDL
ncbi:MAG: ParA family protein, partial [Dolichospermum sp.]